MLETTTSSFTSFSFRLATVALSLLLFTSKSSNSPAKSPSDWLSLADPSMCRKRVSDILQIIILCPLMIHKGHFRGCNSPINGADLGVGWPAAWGVVQSGTTENTEQPGPNERRAGLESLMK